MSIIEIIYIVSVLLLGCRVNYILNVTYKGIPCLTIISWIYIIGIFTPILNTAILLSNTIGNYLYKHSRREKREIFVQLSQVIKHTLKREI